MEKKVYEGYKKTSAKTKTTATKSAAAKKTTSQGETTKKPNARLAGKSTISKPRIAMFIDVDNTGISRENLLEILFFANGKYKIELCKLYGFSDDTLPGIRDFASEYNVTTVGKMKFKQSGVNSLDSRLLVDAYECALNNKNKIDMIFVWCYPCDLESLFEKMVKLGVNTATIENNAFDCKNKFVSQAFKLYSPYNFTVEQTTYGQVKNEPAVIAPSVDIETKPIKQSQDAEPANTTPVKSESQAGMIDGVVPPVLPRRSIPERSNPNQSKSAIKEATNEATVEDSEDTQPKSLVEEIARKLNLEMPTEEELAAEASDDNVVSPSMFMDMLKHAGFDDLLGEKSLKYEDTIGDL